MTDADEVTELAEEMADALGEGPCRDFVAEAGRIIARKLKERGLAEADPASLDPDLSARLLRSAWIEAATKFPGSTPENALKKLDQLFDALVLDRAGNADGGDTAH